MEKNQNESNAQPWTVEEHKHGQVYELETEKGDSIRVAVREKRFSYFRIIQRFGRTQAEIDEINAELDKVPVYRRHTGGGLLKRTLRYNGHIESHLTENMGGRHFGGVGYFGKFWPIVEAYAPYFVALLELRPDLKESAIGRFLQVAK